MHSSVDFLGEDVTDPFAEDMNEVKKVLFDL